MLPLRLPDTWEKRALKDQPLGSYTTFRIGGPASRLIELSEPEELLRLVRDMRDAGIAWRLIGQGSNLLIPDSGYRGLVLVFRSPGTSIRAEGEHISAPGGALIHDAVLKATDSGLSGLEFAAGIPGTVGGAIYGNAGAYGIAIGDVLESVELIDTNGNVRTVAAEELRFSYRASDLKHTGEIVLKADLKLERGDAAESRKLVEKYLDRRRRRHPDLKCRPCAGSFFKNLAPSSDAERRLAAGELLDEAGAKRMRVGDAAVFERHANIIVNLGDATCTDVLTLAENMRNAVKEKYGEHLEREVIVWEDDGVLD